MTDRLRALLGGALVAAPFVVGTALTASAGEPVGEPVFRFVDPEILESSGLVVTGTRVVTTNDSGDEGRVFVVDPDTGRTVGVTRWDEEPEDVEALAPAGRDAVWVADIGDNDASRESVTLLRVPFADADRTVAPERHELTHADGAADAEALLAHPRTGRLYVVTKGTLAGQVLAAPRELGEDGELRPVGPAPGMVTGGSFFPDGEHLVLRSYRRATVLRWPSLETVGSWQLPAQRQGEAVAVATDGSLWLSSEGLHEELLRVAVPRRVQAAMTRGGSVPGASPTPDREPPSTPGPVRDDSQWWIGTAVAVVAIVVLVRSLRPH